MGNFYVLGVGGVLLIVCVVHGLYSVYDKFWTGRGWSKNIDRAKKFNNTDELLEEIPKVKE